MSAPAPAEMRLALKLADDDGNHWSGAGHDPDTAELQAAWNEGRDPRALPSWWQYLPEARLAVAALVLVGQDPDVATAHLPLPADTDMPEPVQRVWLHLGDIEAVLDVLAASPSPLSDAIIRLAFNLLAKAAGAGMDVARWDGLRARLTNEELVQPE